LGGGAHLRKCSISKVAGQTDDSLGGRLKLKGMTAFFTESSWCERAMTPRRAWLSAGKTLIYGVKTCR
ncbi:MAG: hypothetical protein WCD85_15285, partial [Pantoea agglomerans]